MFFEVLDVPTTILYLKEVVRVFWPVVCIGKVKVAYAWLTLVYAGMYAHKWRKIELNFFSYLEYDSSTRA